MPGAPLSDGKNFLVFTYIWQKDFAKFSEVPWAPRNVNPSLSITWLVSVTIRGRVKDTRLEAKDTKKKLRGQKQPFREQTLSRPRIGMLEAKDKGHSRKCSEKKKIFKKSFSGNLQFLGVARIFNGGGQTTNHLQ